MYLIFSVCKKFPSLYYYSDVKEIRDEISRLNKLGEALSSEWYTLVLQLSNKTVTVDNANSLHPYEYLSKGNKMKI